MLGTDSIDDIVQKVGTLCGGRLAPEERDLVVELIQRHYKTIIKGGQPSPVYGKRDPRKRQLEQAVLAQLRIFDVSYAIPVRRRWHDTTTGVSSMFRVRRRIS